MKADAETSFKFHKHFSRITHQFGLIVVGEVFKRRKLVKIDLFLKRVSISPLESSLLCFLFGGDLWWPLSFLQQQRRKSVDVE